MDKIKNTAPLVSIVIPIYNVEKYLNECIQSVVNQTYENLEIILVDDGSPDNCPSICDEWAQKDSRIKVIHKKNGGLGYARNTGIDNATGDFIYFMDSDDFIDSKLVERCVDVLINDKSDIVLFGFSSVDVNGVKISDCIPSPSKNLFVNEEVRKIFLKHFLIGNRYKKENWNLFISACMCMFSLDIIKKNNFRFVSEREIISEDIFFLLGFYSYVKKVSIINSSFYNYRKNMQSLSNTFKKDRLEKNNIFYLKSLELCNELNYDEEISRLCVYPYLRNHISALKMIVSSNLDKKQKFKEFKKAVLDDTLQESLKRIELKHENIKKKILFFFIKHKFVWLSYMLFKLKVSK